MIMPGLDVARAHRLFALAHRYPCVEATLPLSVRGFCVLSTGEVWARALYTSPTLAVVRVSETGEIRAFGYSNQVECARIGFDSRGTFQVERPDSQ